MRIEKVIVILGDFLINISGVLIIRQEQSLGSYNILLNSLARLPYGSLIQLDIRSAGVLPFLSFTDLEAPLISKLLTGLTLLIDSTDLTAKCKGVKPSISFESNSVTQLNK
jgi:hypothetical protein